MRAARRWLAGKPICLFLLPMLALLPPRSAQAAGVANIPFPTADQNASAMKKFSPRLRTHCLGRYLIDLPVDLGSPELTSANLYFRRGEKFQKFEINMPEAEDIDRSMFQRLAYARRDKLKSARQAEINTSQLIHEEILELPAGGALMLRRHDDTYGPASTIVSELHVHVGGRYVILKGESYPPENSLFTDRIDLYKLTDPLPVENQLRRIGEQLSKVEDLADPVPGFCINNVMVDMAALGYDEERATFEFFTNAGKIPTLNLTVQTVGKYGYETTTLHDRMQTLVEMMAPPNDEMVMRVLRRGDRQLALMQFQEWGHEIYAYKYKTTEYGFLLQAMPPARSEMSVMRPAVSISLLSGGSDEGASSPYGLQELQDGWDRWLSTFRLAPANLGP